jgi:hypothetical protein
MRETVESTELWQALQQKAIKLQFSFCGMEVTHKKMIALMTAAATAYARHLIPRILSMVGIHL